MLRTGRSGIFPAQYVHISNSEDRAAGDRGNPQRERDGVTIEISTVLREWQGLLKTYYRERKVLEFKTMKERLTIMFDKVCTIVRLTYYHKLTAICLSSTNAIHPN